MCNLKETDICYIFFQNALISYHINTESAVYTIQIYFDAKKFCCFSLEKVKVANNLKHLQNRRMKWKKENKSKVEGGEGLDESPEPPSQ